jgi:hypothetical protein
MIEFKYDIHKKTRNILKYKDWLNGFNNNLKFTFWNYLNGVAYKDTYNYETDKYDYYAKDIIFSDDFELIYDSKVTKEELQELIFLIRKDPFSGYNQRLINIKEQAEKELKNRESLECKYNIRNN